MPTLMISLEVDDVDHWLISPRRDEVFGRSGMTVRPFVDPGKTNRVGLIVEVPDMDTFHKMLETKESADAMTNDGVRPETILVLVEPGSSS